MKYIDNAIMIAYRKGLLPSSERLLIPQVMRNGEYLTKGSILSTEQRSINIRRPQGEKRLKKYF